MRHPTHPQVRIVLLTLLLVAVTPILSGLATAADADLRDQVVVTQDPSDTRRLSYADYRAQAGPPAPFVAERVLDSRLQGEKILLIVNSSLWPSISSAIDRYWLDLQAAGYDVELHTTSGGTPAQLRTYLQGQMTNLAGAVLVGDLPVPWFEIDYDFDGSDPDTLDNEYADFPCDLFYMDLDGTWLDQQTTYPFQYGVYDLHTAGSGDMDPEIWVCRLTASPMTLGGATEAGLVNNYFAKNHAFREGDLYTQERALVYVDDDWESWSVETNGHVGMAYPNRLLIDDSYTTCRNDYRDVRLTQNFEWMHIMLHSSHYEHFFKVGGVWEMDGGSYATVNAPNIESIDPVAVFYNLYACSNCRYVETDYMGGWYIFVEDHGLGALGTTKTGGMWDYDLLYGPMGQGESLGRGFAQWFAAQAPYDSTDVKWYYGMTLLGDGALTLRPRVTAAGPQAAEVGVPTTEDVWVQFDRDMSASSFTSGSFSVHGASSGRHAGTYTYDGLSRTITFDASGEFKDGEPVTAVLSRKVKSARNVPPSSRIWSFTAGVGNPTAGAFTSGITEPFTDTIYDVICADLNGDGHPDLAAPIDHNNSAGLLVFLNNGSGGFAWTEYPAQDGARYITCGDFDGDFDTDIAVSNTDNYSSGIGVSVFRNNGAGMFGAPVSVWTHYYPGEIHAGDFNGDGDIDLVTMSGPNNFQHYVELMLNDGSGSFTQQSQYIVRPDCGLRIHDIGDIDGDGDLDLLGVRAGDYAQADDSLAVFFNCGDTSFLLDVQGQLPDGPGDLCANDFDADGDLDLAVASVHTNLLTVLFNDGAGTMSVAEQRDIGGMNSFSIRAGDFDGDGDIDLAQGIRYPTNTVHVRLNDGTGSYPSGANYETWGPNGLACGDLDGDRDLDLALAWSSRVSTLINDGGVDVTPPARVSDLGGSTAGRDTTVTLIWTAPGDDGHLGRASQYALRYATDPVGSDTTAWWNAATPVPNVGPPSPAGVQDACDVGGLATGNTYYFLLISADEVPNWSGYSNLAVVELSAGSVENLIDPSATRLVLKSYPNPLLSRADIVYALPSGGPVRLTVFDPQGRRVATLVDGMQAAGVHRMAWDARPVDAGVYFYRLESGGTSVARKLVVAR